MLKPGLRISTKDMYNLIVDYLRKEWMKEVEAIEDPEERKKKEEEIEKKLASLDQRSVTRKLKKFLAPFGVICKPLIDGYYFIGIGLAPKDKTLG